MNLTSTDNQIGKAAGSATNHKPRRLRRCCLGVLAVSVILFVGLIYCRYQRQRDLIERGTVVTKPMGPQWFRDLVGEEVLKGFEEIRFVQFLQEPTEEHLELLTRHGVVTLTLRASCVSERGIASIGQMDSLQHFGLFECSEVPENLLTRLAELPKLRVLELNRSSIPDAAMRKLKLLEKLENLTLKGSKFDPRLLVVLSESTRLYSLNLSDTSLSDDDLSELKALSGLEGFLFLSGTSVGDRGLEHLKSFRKLRALGLAGTRVTDDGLPELAGMTSLEYLDLSDTAVTDAGVQFLEKLSHLTELNLSGTKVTEAGLRELRTALADCEIQISSDRLNMEPAIGE